MPAYQFIILISVVVLFGAFIAFMLIRLALMRQNDALNITRACQDAAAKAVAEFEARFNVRIGAVQDEHARDIEQLKSSLSESISLRMDGLFSGVSHGQDALKTTITDRQSFLEKQLGTKQDALRSQVGEQLRAIETSLKELRETNERQLDSIRGVVNEKLQQTLNERLSESFKRVDERLTEVYKGLGEMQSLASGVGDLKKVLSNVKTRGTLGEIQLRSILEEVLAPEQYVLNFDAGKGTNERVEFAVKLPNNGDTPVFLPIDSKFPADMYIRLNDAYESGDPDAVDAARRSLRDSLIRFAKDIHDKYINPPRTTNFAVMFLPTEGLYAEAVRLGLIETLQSRFRINISGPSTMAALLNSLQMGFRTLAIQKRSGEVWQILAQIKKEFGTFDDVLTNTRRALLKANDDLDKLVGVRTRQIRKALEKVEALPSSPDENPVDLLSVSPEDTDDVD